MSRKEGGGRLSGKVAIVTGGSRGIGRAIAKLFASEGSEVMINYNASKREAEALHHSIGQSGGHSSLFKADVSIPGEVQSMVSSVYKKFGQIDILVNNAGVLIVKDFLRSTEQDWDATMNVNLRGAYVCSREVAPIMIKQKRGKIINISSISGLAHNSAIWFPDYVSSKAGMIGLTRSLAVNLGPYVNVNAIAPGLVLTDMVANLDERTKKLMLKETPLKRLGTPRDIANAALFLASSDSDFITGEVLTVSGGRGMR